MAKSIYRTGTTGVGTLMFPHLLRTEEFQGQDTGRFAVSFLPDTEEEKQRLLTEIDEEWQKFVESEEGKKHKYKYDYVNGLTTYKDEEYFKYKMQQTIKTKRGDWTRRVPIFDTANPPKEIGAELESIGSGTRGRIAYELKPYYMNDKNYGVSLRLTGVQIIELREQGGATASSLGFDACDGYTYAPASEPTPFDEVPGAEDDF